MRTSNLWASLAAPLAGLAAAVTLAAAPASASLIVDTGDPTSAFGYSLLPAGYVPDFAGQSLAARFTVTEQHVITGVEGWVYRYGSGPGSYHIMLYGDGPGPNHWVPGAELYTVALSDGGPGSGYIGTDDLDWAIGPGAYWAAFEVRDGDTLIGYMPYFVPNPLQEALGPPGGYFPAAGAPGSAFRIYDAAVPEPAAWALMLTGFATAGAALRARRRTPAASRAGHPA